MCVCVVWRGWRKQDMIIHPPDIWDEDSMAADILVDFLVASISWQIFSPSLWQPGFSCILMKWPVISYFSVPVLTMEISILNISSARKTTVHLLPPIFGFSKEFIINCVWHCGEKLEGCIYLQITPVSLCQLQWHQPKEREWNLRALFLSLISMPSLISLSSHSL